MRNQGWNQKGKLIEDLELTRVAGAPTVIDHIAGITRPATTEEEAQLILEEKETKRHEARAKAIADIKANRDNTPWGRILYDLALSQGWIEPE